MEKTIIKLTKLEENVPVFSKEAVRMVNETGISETCHPAGRRS